MSTPTARKSSEAIVADTLEGTAIFKKLQSFLVELTESLDKQFMRLSFCEATVSLLCSRATLENFVKKLKRLGADNTLIPRSLRLKVELTSGREGILKTDRFKTNQNLLKEYIKTFQDNTIKLFRDVTDMEREDASQAHQNNFISVTKNFVETKAVYEFNLSNETIQKKMKDSKVLAAAVWYSILEKAKNGIEYVEEDSNENTIDFTSPTNTPVRAPQTPNTPTITPRKIKKWHYTEASIKVDNSEKDNKFVFRWLSTIQSFASMSEEKFEKSILEGYDLEKAKGIVNLNDENINRLLTRLCDFTYLRIQQMSVDTFMKYREIINEEKATAAAIASMKNQDEMEATKATALAVSQEGTMSSQRMEDLIEKRINTAIKKFSKNFEGGRKINHRSTAQSNGPKSQENNPPAIPSKRKSKKRPRDPQPTTSKESFQQR